jgi:hypothetical protein
MVVGCPATPAADPSNATLMGITLKPGTPLTATPNWCVTVGGPQVDVVGYGNRSASPIVTTTDGKSEPVVWIVGTQTTTPNKQANGTTASILYGVDGELGTTLYSGGTCTGVHQWTLPIAVKGHIVAAGDNHLCSWSPH